MKILINIIYFFSKRLSKRPLISNKDYLSDSQFYYDIENPFIAVR